MTTPQSQTGSQTAAIYVVQREAPDAAYVAHAVAALRALAGHLVIVAEEDDLNKVLELGADQVLSFGKQPGSAISGYRIGLSALRKISGDWHHIILTGSHVFGPVHPYEQALDTLENAGADLFSCYWHAHALDPRLNAVEAPDSIPYLDFAVLGPRIISRPEFWSFWEKARPSPDYWADFQTIQIGFANWCEAAGLTTVYPFSETAMETVDPRQFETHRIVAKGGPVLPVSVFALDPVMHDLNATYLRRAMDELRQIAPRLYEHVIAYIVPRTKPRDFCMISDQYSVLSTQADLPEKSTWGFGRVAVFIHAFYANMMPQFWELIERLPCQADLFISTASPEDKAHIEAFLNDHGWPETARDVREVEANRGRDMSSLFITFRDVILEDRYEVALRLHSKRTPQVSRQVGESFKDHLFENLVANPGYVRNLLDMLESEPDIGLVIPPVIHIGFGTLGHSWFNNRAPLQDLAKKMDLDVAFDDFTPVTAYGTMYWFRTDALKKMFEWEWKWEEYNPEPNHIDGGLAHVQERLIGYCIQDKGYRTVSVMTPENAARNYAKLEYKLQLLAGHMASGNIYLQQQQMQAMAATGKMRLYRWLQNTYGAALRRFPGSRRILRPVARRIQALFGTGNPDQGRG